MTASPQDNPSPFRMARWISSPVCGGPRTPAPAPYFRKAFTLPAAPKQAVLHVTALGVHDLEINGTPADDAIFAPGWTDYRIRIPYRSLDVTAFLKAGKNVLGAILGDGWYCGHIAERNRQYYGDRPQLLALLEVTCEDGSACLIPSDESWTTATGAILENDFLMGESHDARRELHGWSRPDDPSDCHNWTPVRIAEAPTARLVPHEGPVVKRQERLALEIPPTSRRCQIRLDLGQNITGRMALTVRGVRGTTLRIRYAEMVRPDGSLYTENLRGARATDHYTLSGEGSEHWEPRFTFHGFRHVEIDWKGKPGDVVLERAEGVVLHSDMARTGEFSCSHPLLNQLVRNILWGQKGNFLEVPSDCPQRDERLGWTGDAQAFIRTAAFFFDVRTFFQRWLLNMGDTQNEEGAIPATVPHAECFGLPPDGGPAWADAAMICPWTLYLCYGDRDILRDHYPCMSAYMDYLEKHKVKDFIRCHPDRDEWGGFGDWLALDGSGRTEGGTPKDLIGTAFYAHNADLMARTSEVLGMETEARRWRALHGSIVAAFRRRFVTPDGWIAAGTQTAYVLALHFRLVPDAVRADTARQLVRLIAQNGWHLGTGFVGTPYLLHVLEETGHLEAAYRLLEQETFPSWLFPVKQGATTIWERWDGWTPDRGFQDQGMNSFNHYAYGAVGDWMVSTVAGLEIAEPGYRKILFKPRPGGSIRTASAALQTPQGRAAISWKIEDRQLRVECTVPENTTARLSITDEWVTSALPDLGPGHHVITATRTG